jgi:hypothetical protein
MPASVETLLKPKADNVVQFRKPKCEAPKWLVADGPALRSADAVSGASPRIS